MRRRWRLLFGGVATLAALGLTGAVLVATALGLGWVPPEWGASAVLHPWRRPLTTAPRSRFEPLSFASDGVRLEGWVFEPASPQPVPHGLLVYLHGIADNRQSGVGVAARLVPRGYRVLAFDGRAHGRSGGDVCTYGYRERHDVGRALDALRAQRAVVIGHSLGAAVALQAAAVDARVTAVVAASPFSDLPTIVHERARRLLLPRPYVGAALVSVAALGQFPPAEASPVALAARIRVPVLLLHGADDDETPPEHSRRIAARLAGPARLAVLPGVGHDEILGQESAWKEILAFLDAIEAPTSPPSPPAGTRGCRAPTPDRL